MYKKILKIIVLGSIWLGITAYAQVNLPAPTESVQKLVTAEDQDETSIPQPEQPTLKLKEEQPINLAQEAGLKPDSRIKVDGFLSSGLSMTDVATDYLIPERGGVDNHLDYMAGTLGGIRVTGNITPQFAAVIQIFANGQNFNDASPYQVNLDWAFFRYSPSPSMQTRGGRLRFPGLLYSETADVGYTYPWVILPNEVYAVLPFTHFNGADSTYAVFLGKNHDWFLKLQPYLGEEQTEQDLYTTNPVFIPFGITGTFNENSIYGATASIGDGEIFTLQGNYTRFNISGYIPNLSTMGGQNFVLIASDTASLFNISGKLDLYNFIVNAEYISRTMPDFLDNLTAYYGMLGYQWNKFLPYFTYSHLSSSASTATVISPTEIVTEVAKSQRTLSLGLAYYINANIALKLEVNQITLLDGTQGLFVQNPGNDHVYYYSTSVDVVF